MTGWAPHPRQQQPLQRGSATVSFEDLVSELGEGATQGQGGTEGVGGGAGSDGGSQQQPKEP